MPLLTSHALLAAASHSTLPRWPSDPNKAHKSEKQGLVKKASLAALIDLARDPVGSVTEAAKGWYDGLTPTEREAKLFKDARKRALYLQQRDVSSLRPTYVLQ